MFQSQKEYLTLLVEVNLCELSVCVSFFPSRGYWSLFAELGLDRVYPVRGNP